MGKIHMFSHGKTSTGHGIFLVTLCGPGYFGYILEYLLGQTKCVMEGAVDEPSLCRHGIHLDPLPHMDLMIHNTNPGYYNGLETSQ